MFEVVILRCMARTSDLGVLNDTSRACTCALAHCGFENKRSYGVLQCCQADEDITYCSKHCTQQDSRCVLHMFGVSLL